MVEDRRAWCAAVRGVWESDEFSNLTTTKVEMCKQSITLTDSQCGQPGLGRNTHHQVPGMVNERCICQAEREIVGDAWSAQSGQMHGWRSGGGVGTVKSVPNLQNHLFQIFSSNNSVDSIYYIYIIKALCHLRVMWNLRQGWICPKCFALLQETKEGRMGGWGKKGRQKGRERKHRVIPCGCSWVKLPASFPALLEESEAGSLLCIAGPNVLTDHT